MSVTTRDHSSPESQCRELLSTGALLVSLLL
jgi:hypothetical protein